MRQSNLLLVAIVIAGCTQPNGDGTDGGSGGGGGSIDAPDPTGDAGVTQPSHAVTIIVEPSSTHGSELVTAINAAHTSVYMTMYEIDNSSVLSALVARKQAGLDVEVVLDSSTQTKSFNMPAYTQLLNANIPVVWSNSSFSYTHEKCVIIDGHTAWIMTMNANTSSPTSNREYLAIDTDPSDVAEATAVFTADHMLHAVTPSGNLVVANANARPRIVALINSATKTLDVEGEEFSDTNNNGVVDAVVAAAHRGVTVHVIIGNSSPIASPITLVKNAGGHVVVTGPTSGNGTSTNPYIHAKSVVVDCVAGTCAKAFVGSENFSAGSLGYNRELGVIFDTATEIAKVKTAIDTDFGHGVAQ